MAHGRPPGPLGSNANLDVPDKGTLALTRTRAPGPLGTRPHEHVARTPELPKPKADHDRPAGPGPPPAAGAAALKKAPKKKLRDWTLVSLTYVQYVASGKENPKPKVKWVIHDPDAQVTQGKLELFRTHKPADSKPIWTRPLSAGEVTDGSHELAWDGQIDAHADFPDAYASVEYSPYRLRITVSDGGRKERKEVKFEVVVVEVEIFLGDKAVLGDAKDKALYDVIKGGVAADGKFSSKLNVKLISNLFKVDAPGSTGNGEMSNSSTASFDQFKTLWDKGPRIPVDAKVWIKNSTGARVLAPKAWGKRRLLWDWECVSPNLSGLTAAARTYVQSAHNYNKATSSPSGENCHADRGGKRVDSGASTVFTSASGGASYPYVVTACTTRTWAAFSEPVKSGAKEGWSGTILQPARMAGDGYQVTAYFDPHPNKNLDAKGAVSAAFKSQPAKLEMWREIHLSKYIKKSAAIPSFSVAAFQRYYEKAFVRAEDKTSGIDTMTKAPYDTAFTTAIGSQPAHVTSHCIDSTVSQFDGGSHAVTFRSFAAMKASLVTKLKSDLSAASHGTMVDPALTTMATANAVTALTGLGIETAAKYADQAKWWAISICEKACGIYMATKDGVTIIQFDGTDNLVSQATGTINGFAPTFSTSGRSKCAFIQYLATYSGDANTMEQTISHEIGHHMFLPHAPLPAGSLPGGAQAAAHDKADLHCMMGYDFTSERQFCGKCLLRMRGWDHTKLDQDGSKNKKP